MRVLVVEDDRRLADLVKRGLSEAGMRVDLERRGDAALVAAERTTYDAIVLDRMLPGLDGMQVCRTLRERRVATPILMLTARGDLDDRIDGLNCGADDYMAKPFSLREVAARLQALGRRGPLERPVVLAAGTLKLDPTARQAWRGDVELELSTTERQLLEVFLRHPGQILERAQLLRSAWDGSADRSLNIVDVYVRYLREKVDRPFGLKSIETIRGTGYRLRKDGGQAA
ncbi:MAG: two-component system, OmpR family, response regulator [Solirubrobacteraceae bacterium]|jgi:two-component system OmpR family response regulator|nr:two-component system, OmpR family, response regulator [Solirubrobacteraceae bacterium]